MKKYKNTYSNIYNHKSYKKVEVAKVEIVTNEEFDQLLKDYPLSYTEADRVRKTTQPRISSSYMGEGYDDEQMYN